MNLNLEKKVAIVTGSSRGIGRAIAESLASEGCHVVICARSGEELEKAAIEIRKHGGEVLPLILDLSDKDDVDKLIKETIKRFNRIDIIVNNVGSNRRADFAETTDDDWSALLNLNLLTHVRASRAAIPYMKSQKGGAIIFIASIFGREAGGQTLSIYNTTKSGIISLAKTMALELAPHNIRVNSVAPGSIRFPGGSWDRRCRENPEAMAEFVKREIPMGRFGSADEVANVVTFLASEKASWVTGACINVDGCQSHSLI